jgi:hypothetical protein
MKKLHLLAAGLLVWACTAVAGGPRALQERIEASVVVTGSISIAADGSVIGHTLDHPDKLEPGIVALVDRTVARWRFEPVLDRDKKAVAGIASMSLRLVANRPDADHYVVRIRSAYFQEANQGESGEIRHIKASPPRYPGTALRSGIGGTVYLVARIDADGKVLDAAVEQVNLGVLASDSQMNGWRGVFAASALEAAKRWEFSPAAKEAAGKARSVRVPISYVLSDSNIKHREPEYGKWESYIPGPKHSVPWLHEEDNDSTSPDALAAGGVYEVGKGLRLLTPLQAG